MIGIIGQAQHGKDTIANILAADYDYQLFAYGDALKEFLLAVDPTIALPNGTLIALSELIISIGWDEAKRNFQEVRRLLQATGTEGGRKIFGDNCWVNATFEKFPQELFCGATVYQDNLAIKDVRFYNEIDAILKHSQIRTKILIGVVRPNFDNGVDSTHASEKNVPELLTLCNVVIENDSNLFNFQEKIRQTLKGLIGESKIR